MNQQKESFAIRIDTTANGYMVQPVQSLHNDRCTVLADTHVFESFDALVQHIRNCLPIYPVFDAQPTPTKSRR